MEFTLVITAFLSLLLALKKHRQTKALKETLDWQIERNIDLYKKNLQLFAILNKDNRELKQKVINDSQRYKETL